MRRYILLFGLLSTVFFGAFSSLQAQDDYYDEEEDVFYEEFVFQEDSTDRLIDEAVEEKKLQKQKYIIVDSVSKTDVSYKEIEKEKWDAYHNKRDYIEKEKEEPSDFNMPNMGFEGLGFMAQLIKMIVYAVVVLGLAFLIFKLFEAQYRQDRKISTNKEFFLEKLEEQIHDIDLYKLLDEYSQKKDYAMMIRIQYLIIIKEMSQRKIIDWQKQKTNGAYLQEVYGHTLFSPFQKVTRLYERVWFGEVSLDEQKYNEIVPQFRSTLEQTKKINIG